MWYLRKCLPEAEFVETPFEAEPAFASEDVGLIYLGPMTERTQERVIEKLRPLSDRFTNLSKRAPAFYLLGMLWKFSANLLKMRMAVKSAAWVFLTCVPSGT